MGLHTNVLFGFIEISTIPLLKLKSNVIRLLTFWDMVLHQKVAGSILRHFSCLVCKDHNVQEDNLTLEDKTTMMV